MQAMTDFVEFKVPLCTILPIYDNLASVNALSCDNEAPGHHSYRTPFPLPPSRMTITHSSEPLFAVPEISYIISVFYAVTAA